GVDPSLLSELAVPILSPFDKEVVGILNIESEKENAFSAEDQMLFEALADKVSIFLEREEVETRFSSLRKLIQKLEQMSEPTEADIFRVVGDFMEETFAYKYYACMMIDEEKNVIKIVESKGYIELPIEELTLPLDSEKGVVIKCIKEGKPINIGDVKKVDYYIEGDERINSELVVPIQVNRKIVGVMNIESEARNAFSKTDERVLQVVCALTGLVLKNIIKKN
ncbi:MAG: GAF domain-containing protein, partial [Candidatus Heimdallarchaeaceae archaeon]